MPGQAALQTIGDGVSIAYQRGDQYSILTNEQKKNMNRMPLFCSTNKYMNAETEKVPFQRHIAFNRKKTVIIFCFAAIVYFGRLFIYVYESPEQGDTFHRRFNSRCIIIMWNLKYLNTMSMTTRKSLSNILAEKWLSPSLLKSMLWWQAEDGTIFGWHHCFQNRSVRLWFKWSFCEPVHSVYFISVHFTWNAHCSSKGKVPNEYMKQ